MRSWVRVVTVPEYEAYIKDLGAQLDKAQTTVLDVQQSASEGAAP